MTAVVSLYLKLSSAKMNFSVLIAVIAALLFSSQIAVCAALYNHNCHFFFRLLFHCLNNFRWPIRFQSRSELMFLNPWWDKCD